MSAYCYLESDVVAVRVIVEAEGRPAWSGELAVEPELLVVRVAVGPVGESSPATPLSADRRFLFVGSPEQLQPGDVYVGSAGSAERGLREALRARGVHVLAAGGPAGSEGPEDAGPEGSAAAGPEGSAYADPLRGRDLGRLESLDRLPQALAARWEDLLAYKEGFVGLVSQRRLHGLPPLAAEKAGAGMAAAGKHAAFAGRAEEAAFHLERQVIPARLEAGTRVALLAFYVLAMGLLAAARRPRLAALGARADERPTTRQSLCRCDLAGPLLRAGWPQT